MTQTTTCPLDCYDACRILIDTNGKLKGDESHPITQGYLCPHLNHFDEYERILEPRLNGKTITMNEAMEQLCTILQNSDPQKTLFYRGSGNIGLMQRSTDHFFAGMGAVGTRGSLCDGAGEAGILEGRGANYTLSPSIISEAEVVIVWGRNPHVTHSHLLRELKNKFIVVIDPVQTTLAKTADIYIQIKPHCDLQLALLLSRFVVIEGSQDTAFLEEYGSEYQDFYELTQTLRIKSTLETIDVTLGQIGSILESIRGKKTVILVGTGVQKYRNGAQVLRAIDGFGAILGLFGKPGCGIGFLGSSTQGLELPFRTVHKTIPKPTIDFSLFDTVFVQGGNPLSQMPNSTKVTEGFKASGFKIYFGLYENETSAACDLILPAKTFLEKEDVRSSYGDYTLQKMSKLRESEIGISEYDLASALCNRFSLSIPTQDECLDCFYDQMVRKDGVDYRKDMPDIPYANGFETDSGEFEFLDEIDLDPSVEEGLFLLTPKAARSLNSQFHRSSGVHLHPQCGFTIGESVTVSSRSGSIQLLVYHDERLRSDCAIIYAGTPGLNHLTPSLLSYEGENAVYQENKIKVEKC
ncbi:MAG TPA: molybdopterin-dependent oxidoreductase [Sulfuricurvum sp.]|nr:molybdopterin-dependent oxidoreductase [Sulfuricurvum sp.]